MPRRFPTSVLLTLACASLIGCRNQAARDQAEASTAQAASTPSTDNHPAARPMTGLRPYELPDAPGSSSPSLGVGADELHLVWMNQASEPSLMLASLPHTAAQGSAEWSEAQLVSSSPRMLVNWADVPVVAETSTGRVVVAWPEHHSDDPGAGYGLRVAARLDDGSFGPGWSPDGNTTGAETGFASFISTAAGLHMFWLDGRELEPGNGSGDGDRGTMKLRTVLIDDEGQQAGPSLVLDERTCECCKLDVGQVGGRPFAAYRDRSDTEIRDIFVAGPGLPPGPVAEDGWKITGCPVNGPAVASDGEQAHVAWFTGAADRSVMQIASGSPGEGFGAPTRFDLGFPAGRVDLITTPGGGALVSWFELEEQVPGQARLLARRVGADGHLGDTFEIAQVGVSRDWGFPRAARIGDQVLWLVTDPTSEDGQPRLLAWVATMPAAS